jgi:hypothetical protein
MDNDPAGKAQTYRIQNWRWASLWKMDRLLTPILNSVRLGPARMFFPGEWTMKHKRNTKLIQSLGIPRRYQPHLRFEPLEPRCVLDGTLVFNEVMYHPAGTANGLEWIELHNQQTINMDISGWRVSGGINFSFLPGTVVPGRGYMVIAENPAALRAATGFADALGPWAGRLDNDGESLRLVNNSDRPVDELDYGDDAPWPVGPDGIGATLAKRSRDLATADPANWTVSGQLGGTPGAINFPEIGLPPVITTTIPDDATWRYHDAGVDLGTTWRDPAFDDATWQSGTARFFAGTSTTELESPLEIGGLVLWLDADAAHITKDANNRVSAWNDSTGLSNNIAAQNVTQATGSRQPVWIADAIHGRPAIRFDGGNDLLNNTVDNLLAPGTDRTIVVVGDAHDEGEGGSLVTLRRNGPVFNAQIAGPNTYVYTDGVAVNILAANLLPTIRSPFVSVHRVSGNTLTLDVNGQTKTSGTIQAFENGATGFTIGNREDHNSQHWHGDIAEVLVFDRQLSQNELRALNSYLNSKYQINGAELNRTELPLGPSTYYFRHEFSFAGDPALAQLRFTAAIDDGAVYYLNGQEIHRQNMPTGTVGYATPARGPAAPAAQSTAITVPEGILRIGENVLAVEVHQAVSPDADMLFGLTLSTTISPPAPTEPIGIAFSEIAAASNAQFFVELANNGSQARQVAGLEIVSSGRPATPYRLPSQVLAPGAHLTVTAAQLGYTPGPGDRLFLFQPAESHVVDAAVVTDRLRGRLAEYPDRWLYPDRATSGGTNHFTFETGVVINEIMYRPRNGSAGQWIELFNRSAQPVDLSQWQLADGVEYTFPAGTILRPGQYLVVAQDATALAVQHPAASVVGNWSGRLSGRNDVIELRDAAGNPVDGVRYFDDGYWPKAADGGGSSLELRDPSSDNSRAQSWSASDESHRGQWQTIDYTGTAARSAVGSDTQWKEFVFGLLDSGEMLIDDLQVIQDPQGTAIPLLQNGTFESDAVGSFPAKWRVLGTHGSHGLSRVIVDPDDPGNHVLHLVATGASEQLFNHAETTLKNGDTIASISNGTEYRISLRAKPISGSAQLNTRLYFNRLARTTVLAVPLAGGTPGAVNSRFVANTGPTYAPLTHSPVVPRPGEPVDITIAATDSNGVANMTLSYNVAGTDWVSVPMTRLSTGSYRGTIPGQAADATVQFYVTGVDGLGVSSDFPAQGRQSRAMLRFASASPSASPLDEFMLIMTDADATYMHQATNALSNDLLRATVIYRGQQVFYDAGVRLKGSERGRGQEVRYGYVVRFHGDNLFRGVYDRVDVDRSSPFDVSARELLVKHAANSAGGIPGNYDDLIHLVAPRSPQTGDSMLMLDKYGDDYLDTQFENGSDGTLFELELVYYPTSTVDRNPESLKLPYPSPDNVIGIPTIGDMGDDKERYRHTYLIHNNHELDDYSHIMAMAKAFSLRGDELLNALPAVIDVDQFLRVYALENLFGIEDSYATGGLLHNAEFFVRPEDGRILLFPHDMDFAFAKPATGPLVQNVDLRRMIASPTYAHAYYGHLHDLITRTFNSTYADTWVAYYDSLLAESFASQRSYIGTRSSYILRQLNTTVPPIDFAITTNSGDAFTVDTPTVTIEGDGWIDIRQLYLTGRPEPLELIWTDVDSWQVTVPLAAGANTLSFQAVDFQGKTVGNDAVIVTTTSGQPAQDSLRVTELMYHPGNRTPAEIAAGFANDDDFEYLEIQNIGSQTVDLTGVKIDGGVSFAFSGGAVTRLEPGRHVLVVANSAAFAERYNSAGRNIAGVYSGRLNNGGEELRLLNSLGQPIHTFRYDDAWHAETDGRGRSLEVVDPRRTDLDAWNRVEHWAPSILIGGTPGSGRAVPGDSNHDGRFNSSDLVLVFQSGKYEDSIPRNATFEEGDWNGDGDFTTADMVLAFQSGNYVLDAVFATRPNRPLPRTDMPIHRATDAFFAVLDEEGDGLTSYVA